MAEKKKDTEEGGILRGVGDLPELIANDPQAYAKLLGYQFRDPLAYWKTFGGGEGPRSLGASNGMVVYSVPDYRTAGTAMGVAEVANILQQKKLEEEMKRLKNPAPNVSPDQWERIFGGTPTTREDWEGTGGGNQWASLLQAIVGGLGSGLR